MRKPKALFTLAVLASVTVGSNGAAGAQTAPSATAAPSLTYPSAPTSDTTDTYFGTSVPDRFRPLESLDAPATRTWVAAENKLTRDYLDALPARASIAAAYKKLRNYPRYSQPFREGSRYFYTYNPGLLTSSLYYVRDSENGPSRLFWDPNKLSKDGSIQATATIFSKDGSLMAYSTSVGGEDWQTWHVKVVATGRDTADIVRWSKYSGASWDGDRGFYYAGYDAPAKGKERMTVAGIHKVWFHTLGTPQAADRLVFASIAHPDRFVGVDLSYDQRFAFLYQESGDTSMLSWKRRDRPDSTFSPLTTFTKNISYSVVGNDGSKVYLYTNAGAPNFRIVSTDLLSAKHDLTEVIPESKQKLESYSLIGKRFYLYYLRDAHAVVRIADTSGKYLGELPLPAIGSGGLPSARREDRIAYYSFSSYALPSTIYRFDTKTQVSTVYLKSKIPFDGTPYVTKQIFATSKDGTKVPVFITYRKDIALDGKSPTLLYGYGGFNISETPFFSADRALWLEMGGIYADVVLRGGGEYGDPWHDAGRLDNKQNVFDDFTAAAHYLIDNGYTSTPKLAIDGGSNGGLLVGAELTEHPDLFGAAVAEQGVLDMLRYDTFTIGKAWIPEYGSASASKKQFDTLFAYSPLQNVKPGTSYPPTLITTADHDDRVFPAHSLKFAAALQAAQSGSNPILLRVQTNEGHFSGLTTDESIALYADMYAFLAHSLDFPVSL
jgi:prolyl oligopeptidase